MSNVKLDEVYLLDHLWSLQEQATVSFNSWGSLVGYINGISNNTHSFRQSSILN